MKQTVEEAARIEREKVIQELHVAYKMHKDPKHYIISNAAIQKYAVPLFKAGAGWQAKQSPWISVEERLPEKPKYDWVLVIIRDKRDGFIGIPQIGELRSDGFWHTETSDTFNTPNFRRIYNTTDVLGEFLKQEVVAWWPIPSFDDILEANKDVLERIKEKGD